MFSSDRECAGDLRGKRNLFTEVGEVIDVFISKKSRRNSKDGFGFVRFGTKALSMPAIVKFNGHLIKGKKLRISLAKYDRNGVSFPKPAHLGDSPNCRRWIDRPAFRDSRKYSKVVAVNHKVMRGKPGTHEDRKRQVPVRIGLKILSRFFIRFKLKSVKIWGMI